MIKAVKFASIPVADQDRALDFYTRALGFQVATDQPMGGAQRWIELRIPGADTRIVLFTPEGHEDRIGTMSNVAFVADDVHKTAAEMAANGVHFVQEPETAPSGTSAIFEDPDGNTFVMSSK